MKRVIAKRPKLIGKKKRAMFDNLGRLPLSIVAMSTIINLKALIKEEASG